MAREFDGHALRDFEKRKQRYRRRRNFIIVLVVLAVLTIAGAYLFRIYNVNFDTYKVISTKPNDGEKDARFINYRRGIIKYSRAGAIAYSAGTKVLWNESFEMSDPIADTCGNYAVIADRGSKQVIILDQDGSVGSITTRDEIVEAKIAAQGVVVVLMKSDKKNYVKFYYEDGASVADNKDETMLIDIEKSVEKDGYIVSMALPKDGKRLILDFCSLTTGKLVSYIGCYNFGEVGKNSPDGFMGGYPLPDTIVPKVEFLNNNVFGAFMDKGINLYSMREKPDLKPIKKITIKRKIQSILYNEKYIGVVLKEDEGDSKQLQLYDLRGNIVLDKKLDFAYKEIRLEGDEVIMYDNSTCLIIRSSGKQKFKCTFDTNIEAFYPSNRMDRYILITASEISEIVLKE